MPIHYTYSAYAVIPELVRKEFTVKEIKILKLCPPCTLPFRDPLEEGVHIVRRIGPIQCVVCGLQFTRTIMASEHTYETVTCGSVRCVKALRQWLDDAAPITAKAKDVEDELLTFLRSRLYDLFRTKWLDRHKVYHTQS